MAIFVKGENGERYKVAGFGGRQGEPGRDGAAAGFGKVTATVDDSTGTPAVEVAATGPDTAKNFAFSFSGLKGEPGTPGRDGTDGKDGGTGPQGEPGISPTVSVEPIGGGHKVTITDADGQHPFDVLDGRDGEGSGDMLASVYDPQNKHTDVFKYVDNAVGNVQTDLDGKASMEYVDNAIQQAILDSWEGSY